MYRLMTDETTNKTMSETEDSDTDGTEVERGTCESCGITERPVRSILMKSGDRELLCESCFMGALHDDMVDPSDPRVETTEVA